MVRIVGMNVAELLPCISNGKNSVILLKVILILFLVKEVIRISHTSGYYPYLGHTLHPHVSLMLKCSPPLNTWYFNAIAFAIPPEDAIEKHFFWKAEKCVPHNIMKETRWVIHPI